MGLWPGADARAASVGGGSNEIEAIPRLLERLALEGCIATIDAMGRETDVADAIIGAEADHVLRVKDNQKGLRADIERLFERRLARGIDPDPADIDGGHGRALAWRCWTIDVEGPVVSRDAGSLTRAGGLASRA